MEYIHYFEAMGYRFDEPRPFTLTDAINQARMGNPCAEIFLENWYEVSPLLWDELPDI